MTYDDEWPTVPIPEANPDRDTDPPEGPVLNGELVPLEQNKEIDRRLAEARESKNAVTRFRARSATGVLVLHSKVQDSERPAQAGKAIVRHGAYVVAGTGVVIRRWRDAHTATNRYERMMNTAEAAGDYDRAADWESRGERAKQARHQRRMDWIDAPMKLVKALCIGGMTIVGVLLALGTVLAVASKDVADVVAPLMAVVNIVRWIVIAVSVAWLPLVLLAPWAVVAYLWQQGKQRSSWTPPPWMAPRNGDTERGEVVNLTPSQVTRALRDLGIPRLRKAIADDPENGAWMLGTITRYGPGWQVAIQLPPEVTAHKVSDRRATLAGNLDRKAHEVHIEGSDGSEREFTLWVALSGALDRAVPASPLVDEDYGQVDIYRDTMPWGISLKGDPVELNLLQQHFLLAGLSKQGKTGAARALVLWAALDPSVRFLIADLKGFGDWSMFEGLADTLIEGAGDANFIAAADMLTNMVAEMSDRYKRWRALGKKGDIDRAHAQPGSGFEPIFVVIDEAQKLYMCSTIHPDGGDIGGDGKKAIAARAAQALHDQARAVNIHLLQFAQNPTNKNLPAVVREGAMIRASLFVGTESVAKMALGEAPVDTGAAPHALRSGKDCGTVVLAPGESLDLPGGATHTTVRTHYINTQDAHTIAERAKALRAESRAAPPAQQRDLLDDTLTVLGDEKRVQAKDVAARLRELAPRWTPYQQLDGTRLEALLASEGVEVTHVHGYKMVYTVRIHEAWSRVAEADG